MTITSAPEISTTPPPRRFYIQLSQDEANALYEFLYPSQFSSIGWHDRADKRRDVIMTFQNQLYSNGAR